MSKSDREKQIQQAEEMFGDSLHQVGFAKGLYFGRYLSGKLLPYPDLQGHEQTNQLVTRLHTFCREKIDPEAIDRSEDIPGSVITGLGELGVLGACLPEQFGGRGLNQVSYCRILEVLGAHCASTALFVNAHHSIGPRAVVLFGTSEQQAKWLPKMCTGEWISAFALTEPEAGSDAGNVQTRAEPKADGSGWVLNGQKRYITNGALAKMLTVMARTPVPGSQETKISAFIVTPDMPGFEVTEARMPKCGVRGTATSRLAFRDMFVPRENLLGQLGRGLKVALTVLDFGRTTFGASCTGAAKFCLQRSAAHANTRVQFEKPLGHFELVKEKLSHMAASIFAMEATTYQTAALIDSGSEDYMLETAILKVFATERLWRIVNDALQIHGGAGYFNDLPFERMMRDHRIDLIGEGANDVLRAFIALVGMRDVGLELEGILNAFKNPLSNFARLGSFAARRLGAMILDPEIVVRTTALDEEASRLGRLVGLFGSQVDRVLRHYQQEILDRQYQQARVADAACELYAACCVLSRLDHLLRDHHASEAEQQRGLKLGKYFLKTADRRIRRLLSELWENEDDATTQIANQVLGWQRQGLLE